VSEAIRFLHALAQALATMALYSPGHPAARRSVEGAWEALSALLALEAHPAFLFLGGAPVFAGRALHELADWPWSGRLADVAVQRIDFDRTLSAKNLEAFLDVLQSRLAGGEERGEVHLPGVSFGPVVVETAVTEDEVLPDATPTDDGTVVYVDLTDEIEAMRHVFAEARAGRVARPEVDAVARLLLGLLEEHALPMAESAQGSSPPVDAINTALLTMVAAMRVGVEGEDLHRLAVAALWHDIGVARLPFDLATKSALTAEERAIVETHTTRGATLLLEHGGHALALPSLVACEHHLRPDGTGYPTRRFGHAAHWVSSLVGVAAAYVAVRADRPYRASWSAERAMRYVESGAGTVFEADAARMVLDVLRA
jgi:hypothetical protein